MRINFISFDDPFGYRRYAMYIFKSDFIEEINLVIAIDDMPG